MASPNTPIQIDIFNQHESSEKDTRLRLKTGQWCTMQQKTFESKYKHLSQTESERDLYKQQVEELTILNQSYKEEIDRLNKLINRRKAQINAAMNTWFECKIKYEKTGEDGLPKRVVEPYLVDALSFTEAEARITEEIKPFISGDFTVSNIRRAHIAELFENPSGDRWYRAKVNFITLDEEKGIEKLHPVAMMVQASSFKEATDLLIDRLSTTLSDWKIVTIKETDIIDIYKYDGSSEESETEKEASV
jgi:hypothetical protein